MIRVLRAVLFILGGWAAASAGNAATFLVTNVLDSGPGSLREAILNANAASGPDEIHFAIASGPQLIQLTQILPTITSPVIINGMTQPGYGGTPLIEINGALAPVGEQGLKITAGSSQVLALVVNGFRAQFLLGGGHGIVLEGGGDNFVVRCYIGTNRDGSAAVSNAGDGIQISNSSNNRIGGAVPDDAPFFANLISGNGNGVRVIGTSNTNLINGNFIGVSASGLSAIPNSGDGVAVFGGTFNTLGGGESNPPGTTLRNVISGNGGNGVFVAAPQVQVLGNLIGWNSSVTAVLPNGSDGIEINNAAGGAVMLNAIAGNVSNGILVFSGATGILVEHNAVGSNGIPGPGGNTLNGIIVSGANGNTVRNNTVGGNGTNGIRIRSGASGNTLVGNSVAFSGDDGIEINDGATNNVVGGPNPTDSNFIGFNIGNGILITDATTTGNTVLGNLIGLFSDEIAAANGMHGVAITNGSSGNTIGGTAPGQGNRIFYNGAAGIFVESGTTNAIRGNGTDFNGGLGIDLAPLGINPNDPLDPDAGPNMGQNFPVLNSAIGANGATTITGTLQSVASNDFQIDFFASGNCDASGNGEGGVYLGSTMVTTDGAGDASINANLPVISPGQAITATATDSAGNTSELSACIFTPLPVVIQLQPDNGPAAGGTPFGIVGLNFQTGAAVTVGGVAASNITVFNPTNIGADSPALPPGTLNDVTVTNPDGQAGTLVKGFLADFTDVPQAHGFHDFVEKIFRFGVTAGCGFGNYCVDAAVPRDQMAVFLLIARNGPTYVPPAPTGTVFLDVPASAFAAAFIEAISAAGVTAGCGGGNYCPTDPVTRAQMSVFLLRMLEGPSYNPPPATGTVFTDVPIGAFAAAWIEEISRRGITSGCGGGNFCGASSATRGQMAVFLVATFGL